MNIDDKAASALYHDSMALGWRGRDEDEKEKKEAFPFFIADIGSGNFARTLEQMETEKFSECKTALGRIQFQFAFGM